MYWNLEQYIEAIARQHIDDPENKDIRVRIEVTDKQQQIKLGPVEAAGFAELKEQFTYIERADAIRNDIARCTFEDERPVLGLEWAAVNVDVIPERIKKELCSGGFKFKTAWELMEWLEKRTKEPYSASRAMVKMYNTLIGK